jgi:flagellar hook assembly protein FlgD
VKKPSPGSMTITRALAAAAFLAALAPGVSAAADVRLVSREEPLPAGLAAQTAARPAPLPFTMVGLHWRGGGTVSFRTALEPGEWSPWQPARPEADDLPDQGAPEQGRERGWNIGNPYWTGAARYIQYRVSGRLKRLRTHFIASEPEAESAVAVRASRPGIIRRSAWGADESIVRAPPSYAASVRFAVVHHTAGTNSYTASESAAIVRGIQRYHVLANGWNDIGYNFLADKYGQIFEGRGGGIDRNVVGAHAQGFNTGSTGVAVLGTYSSRSISSSAKSALVKLLAWRLDVAHADPLARLTWISGGNPKYPAGSSVRLRVVSGHRDTGPTSCPGDSLYSQLSSIASSAAARGLPKLYDPLVGGGLGGPVRITARLSTSLAWSVTIRDAGGAPVASRNGFGDRVDWTWDASSIFFGAYSYRIEAGPDVRPAAGPVPGPPPLAVSKLRARPPVLTPNGDGVQETTSLRVALTTSSTVDVDILDAGGALVRSLADDRAYAGGTMKLRWDGSRSAGAMVADGRYRARVRATSPGQQTERSIEVVVDRTLGHARVTPTPFSPNGDGRLDTTAISFELARAAEMRVRIMRGTQKVAGLGRPTLAAGSHERLWNGRNKGGVVPDGTYTALVEATTELGTRALSHPVRIDTVRPRVEILRAWRRDGRTFLRVRLSEAATVTIRYGRPRWWNGGTVTVTKPAGRTTIRIGAPSREVKVKPVDEAQNRGKARISAVVKG